MHVHNSLSNASAMRLLIILINTLLTLADKCTIRPYEAKGPKRSGNNGYAIEVDAATTRSDNGSAGFIPGETYKSATYILFSCNPTDLCGLMLSDFCAVELSIRGWRTKFTVQTFRGFVLSALFEDGKPAGKFEVVRGRGDARTSPGCRKGGVSHSNLRPKTSIHTIWKAPDVSTGCVILRASVIESKYVWYSEEGDLTKKFCIQGSVPHKDNCH
ncbi:reeler domain protein [Ancylostoma duodenale]|uniref:Reeler domain protein n=1 Tax=Ancylostoma duodenale TaxID=51022 RepID=A0A0C2DA08_9BILA|nr:reeler domain protein [Ancylostoma duodenale]